ncbi:MAG: hypothetical protein AAF749_06085 [Pseudomonadota bacterium]
MQAFVKVSLCPRVLRSSNDKLFDLNIVDINRKVEPRDVGVLYKAIVLVENERERMLGAAVI